MRPASATTTDCGPPVIQQTSTETDRTEALHETDQTLRCLRVLRRGFYPGLLSGVLAVVTVACVFYD